MRRDIISMCGAFDKALVLSIKPAPVKPLENSTPVEERFIGLADQLGPDGFLGLQVSAGMIENSEVLFLSEGGEADSCKCPTEDDYNWVFENSASVKCPAKADGLFGGGRRVYAVTYEPEETGDAEADMFAGKYPQLMRDHFCELITVLLMENAVIRLISDRLFLFSLPGEITFRLRSIVSMAFPKTARCVEILSDPVSDKSFCRLSQKCFNWSLILFWNVMQLCAITRAEKEQRDSCNMLYWLEKELNIPCEVIKTYSTIPIELLELSVRSFNCLKRDGINTVGDLLVMDDDDLMQVRNLGRRSHDEVKDCLSDFIKRRYESGEEAEEEQEAKKEETIDYREKLDSLIGLEDVKSQIRKIAAYAKMKQDMESKGLTNQPIALHMQFVGNPGTAKTTVARLVAGILGEIGLLSKGELIEVGRADLVGRYEGQTAPKVKDAFERAKGNVLFIDEAYSLVEEWDGAFGDEAINTIVQEMENNRNDTIVIFAGYPDKMEDFISRNPGLRSRVPFKLVFRDYSEEELVQIAGAAAKEKGFSIDESAEPALAKLCREAVDNPELGNGRYCRNLIEHAILDYAERVYAEDNPFVARDFVLLEEDFSTPMETEVSKRKCIGFHSVA